MDSGLLNNTCNCLKVGQVIGAKLTKTIDSLTPLTPSIVEGAIATTKKKKVVELIDGNEKAVLKNNKKAGDAYICRRFRKSNAF